jgi:hypothetical protein
VKHCTNIFFSWRSNPDQQGSRTNRSNDIGSTVGQENQPQIGTVLLHSPSEGCLSIARQMIRLVDYYDLESLLRAKVDLLRLCNFL